MARLSDLPPEVRLKIYDLLLVDPIQQGLRITFAPDLLDGNKIKPGRARCVEIDKGHSTHACRVHAFLHHLDFSDLKSLAATNRTIYEEASQTIYNNAGLTLSNDRWPFTAQFAPVLELFRCYLEQHRSLTREMLLSLAIHDLSAAMSTRDARCIVDLVDTHLPRLRVFEYHVMTGDTGSPLTLTSHFCRNYARAIKIIHPFVALRADIRTTLDLPIPTEPALRDPRSYPLFCKLRQRFVEGALQGVLHLRDLRRVIHEIHAWGVDLGGYLHATQALRADLDDDVLPRILGLDQTLADLHHLRITLSSHRDELCAARTRS